jgi:hypothetical protein
MVDTPTQSALKGFEMTAGGILIEELSQIISQATAPAFLLGAVVALVSVLIGRLNRIVDRGIALVAENNNLVLEHPKGGIPSLRRRAKLLGKAIECAVISGVFITFLVIVAFGSAAAGLNQVYGAAATFVLALSFFAASLICLWAEVRIAIGEISF